MKIYFCDICNESIPLKDINTDRITIEGGRIFCPKCAPKPEKHAMAGSGMSYLLLGLIFALGLALFGFGSQIVSEMERRTHQVELKLTSAEESLADLRSEREGALIWRESVTKQIELLRTELERSSREYGNHLTTLDRREASHHEDQGQECRSAAKGLDERISAEVHSLQASLKEHQAEFDAEKMLIRSLEERIKILSELATARPAEVIPVAQETSPSESPAPALDREALEDREVGALLAKLGSPDTAERYAAIIDLGKYSGPKVAKALEGMLSDPEELVRVAAVDHLKKVGLPTSVPHLIAVLRDRDPFVRKAAKRALDLLAGAAVDFEPDAPAHERESRVKEWERWWEANRERVLNS